MNIKCPKLFSFILLLLLFNCSNEPKQPSIPLPNTPETVSKQWQEYLDNNEIDKVATLSTTKTKAWLAENTVLFLNDDQVYQTQFLTMNCSIEKSSATCHYTIREDGELIEDYFLLKKIDGQWLVDLEDENSNPELDEQIFKEMEKELKLD